MELCAVGASEVRQSKVCEVHLLGMVGCGDGGEAAEIGAQRYGIPQ